MTGVVAACGTGTSTGCTIGTADTGVAVILIFFSGLGSKQSSVRLISVTGDLLTFSWTLLATLAFLLVVLVVVVVVVVEVVDACIYA